MFLSKVGFVVNYSPRSGTDALKLRVLVLKRCTDSNVRELKSVRADKKKGHVVEGRCFYAV